jgi:hypothetical protein
MNTNNSTSYYMRKFAATLPPELRDAVSENSALCSALTKRFKKFVDREEALDKLRSNGMLLELIPEGRRDLALCLAAVSSNGLALQFVPPLLRSRVLKESERYNDKLS